MYSQMYMYIAAKLVLVQVAEKVLTSDVYKMKEPVQKLVHMTVHV